MTSPADATPQQQQAAQTGLVTLLADDLDVAWKIIDQKNLPQTLPAFELAVASLVQQYGAASASLAADFYDAQRASADVKGRFAVAPADPAALEQVETVMGWATRGLWSTQPDVATVQTVVTGAVDKMVLDAGRSTVLNAVYDDNEASGWARVTKAGACAFCRMLATRGAIYKTRSTASFQAHDHDRCFVEPLFGVRYEMTAQARDDLALYRRVTHGKSGRAARLAFRQAVQNGS